MPEMIPIEPDPGNTGVGKCRDCCIKFQYGFPVVSFPSCSRLFKPSVTTDDQAE